MTSVAVGCRAAWVSSCAGKPVVDDISSKCSEKKGARCLVRSGLKETEKVGEDHEMWRLSRSVPLLLAVH